MKNIFLYRWIHFAKDVYYSHFWLLILLSKERKLFYVLGRSIF
jgi:hypothetical protein